MNKRAFDTAARRLARQAALVCAIGLGLSSAGAALAAAPFEDTIAQRTLACTACHGPQGRAAPDGYYPRLAGKPALYLYNQLLNFRDGRRHYGLMEQLITPLSDAYLMEIAQYFAALEVPYPAPLPATSPADVLRLGRQLALQGDPARQVPACAQCHGTRMTGVLPATPGLLGLSRDYLNAQLGAWKAGQRQAQSPDCMKEVASRLSLQDINAAASWIAAQPLPADTRPAASLSPPAPGSIDIACTHPATPATEDAIETKAKK
ncbi:MAG: c-type cytochrome [Polaromonas sp.]